MKFYHAIYYSGVNVVKKALDAQGITFSTRDVFRNNFWGIEFTIPKVTGKGSTVKNKQIENMLVFWHTSQN